MSTSTVACHAVATQERAADAVPAARYIDFTPPGGARVRRPLGRGDRAEAEAAAVAFVTKWARDQVAVRSDSLEVVAARMILRKRDIEKRAPGYVSAIEGHFKNHIFTRLDGRRPIGTFDRAELTAFRADLATVVAAEFINVKTANRVLTTLRQALKFAEREYEVALPALPPNFREQADGEETWKHLEPEAIATLLAKLPDDVRPLFGLVANTGLRIGTALATERAWLDLGRKIIRYPARVMKGRRIHEIELNAEAINAVETAIALVPSDTEHLFPYSYWYAYDRWVEVCRALEIEARIHDVRHSFVSNLLAADVPIHVVQRLAGHTDIRTTQRYAHHTDAARRQAVDKVQIKVAAGAVVPLGSGARGTRRGTKRPGQQADGSTKAPEKPGLSRLGHGGLEPPANGLRVHCSTN